MPQTITTPPSTHTRIIDGIEESIVDCGGCVAYNGEIFRPTVEAYEAAVAAFMDRHEARPAFVIATILRG